VSVCRVCLSRRPSDTVRQELATREHMLDHGQLGPVSAPLSTANSFSAEGTSSFSPDDGMNESETKSTTTSSGVSDEKNIDDVASVKVTTGAEVSTSNPRTVLRSSEELRARLLDLSPNQREVAGQSGGSLPILLNPKCSGYFVEPVSCTIAHFNRLTSPR